MIDTNVMTTVQNCLDSGVILTLLDGEKLSIKGNKQAPALAGLRALVASNRQAVLTAVEVLTLQRVVNASEWNAWNDQVIQSTKAKGDKTETPCLPDKKTNSQALVPELDFTPNQVEELPVFPLPPMRVHSKKPALPRDMWVTGAASADAWEAYQGLKQSYFCAWGHDSRGFSVTCDPREFEVWEESSDGEYITVTI